MQKDFLVGDLLGLGLILQSFVILFLRRCSLPQGYGGSQFLPGRIVLQAYRRDSLFRQFLPSRIVGLVLRQRCEVLSQWVRG